MVIQNNFTMLDHVDTPTTSAVKPNPQGDVCYLTIEGTFSSASIVFEGRSSEEFDFTPLAGVNMEDFSLSKGVFTKAGCYQVDVLGARQVRVKVESISGGNVTVFAQLISISEV